MVGKPDLLKNEKILMFLRPHPFSFFSRYFLSILLLLWPIFSYLLLLYKDTGKISFQLDALQVQPTQTFLSLWVGGILAFGVVTSLLSIRWRRLILYILYLAGAFFILYYQEWLEISATLQNIFLYSLIVSLIGICGVEMSRKSHKFYLTNYRILLSGGILRKNERNLSYENISDTGGSQSLVGRIFNYGTLTPITVSGFGLGDDSSASGVSVNPAKSGQGGRIHLLFGGGRSTQVARARSYYELFGVHPYKKVKNLLNEKIHEFTRSAKEDASLEIQKQILEELRRQRKGENKDREIDFSQSGLE
jgi:hypothetical protein